MKYNMNYRRYEILLQCKLSKVLTHSSLTDILICNQFYRICLYNLADLS